MVGWYALLFNSSPVDATGPPRRRFGVDVFFRSIERGQWEHRRLFSFRCYVG